MTLYTIDHSNERERKLTLYDRSIFDNNSFDVFFILLADLLGRNSIAIWVEMCEKKEKNEHISLS